MEVNLPANWDEIIASGKYPDVIKVLQTEFQSLEACNFALFKCLTGYDAQAAFANVPMEETSLAELFLSATLLEEVFPMLEFITNRTPFYKRAIPEFTHKNICYCSPSEKLMDQTGDEWAISHHAEHLYKQTGDKTHLISLVAANYHQKFDKDTRTPFNDKQHEEDTEAFADLPEEIIFGIYLWYQHADDWWSIQFPHLFAATDNPQKQVATGLEVRNIVFELAGNKLDDAWDKLQKRTRQDIIYALDRLESRRE